MNSISTTHSVERAHSVVSTGSSRQTNSHRTHKPGFSSKDTFQRKRPVASSSEEEVIHDSEFKLKQYGTSGLITGGVVAASVFMFAPEPLVTKIIGGAIALLCIAAGGAGKHIIYQRDYVHRSLENSLSKLDDKIFTLEEELRALRGTNKDLKDVNRGLKQTKNELQLQVKSLKGEVDRLQSKVVEAFAQLNEDRRAFQSQKATKLKQLVDEIEEADARGDRATKELEDILARAMELDTLEDELNERRKMVVLSEKRLRRLQRKLLSTKSENTRPKDRLARARK